MSDPGSLPSHSDSILVRVSPEILERMKVGDVEPVVILGVQEHEDGTYDMTLQIPEDPEHTALEGAVDLLRAIREPIEDVYQDSGNWTDLRAVRRQIDEFLEQHGGR